MADGAGAGIGILRGWWIQAPESGFALLDSPRVLA
jgi:hypothetical protein